MCGIVYVQKNNGKAAKAVWKRFQRQIKRGREGFGFVAINNEAVADVCRTTTSDEIRTRLFRNKNTSVLFHHRFPTSTANLEDAAHPIFVSHDSLLKYDYYVVHNGVIRNPDVRKPEHEELGFEYHTEIETTTTVTKKTDGKVIESKTTNSEFNDSESFAIDLALYIEGMEDTIKSVGDAAFIVLQVEKGGDKIEKLIYGRNISRPLTIERRGGFFSITSEGGQYSVPADKMHYYDYSTGETEVKDFEIRTSTYTHVPYVHTPPTSQMAIQRTPRIESTHVQEVDAVKNATFVRVAGVKGETCSECHETIHDTCYYQGKKKLCLTCYGERSKVNMETLDICHWCGVDLSGQAEVRYLGGAPFCPNCTDQAREFMVEHKREEIEVKEVPIENEDIMYESDTSGEYPVEVHIEKLEEKLVDINMKTVDLDIEIMELQTSFGIIDENGRRTEPTNKGSVSAAMAELTTLEERKGRLSEAKEDVEDELEEIENTFGWGGRKL